VARRPVTSFLVMVYAITWTAFLPVVLQGWGLLALPVDPSEGIAFNAVVSVATILGVALPAFLVTGATTGEAGVRDLLSRCLRWRVGVHWYVVALLGFVGSMVLVASVFQGLAPLGALAGKWPLFFAMFLPEVLLPFAFIQIFEEAGWTGFMQHDLQERRGPVLASVLVAPAFFLMHLPALLIDSGVGLGLLIVAGALVIAMAFFRVVVMWLYNGTGRSVLIVALFHSAFNSATSLGQQRFTAELIPGPSLLHAAGVLVAVAVLVVALTRGRLAYKPERATTRPPSGPSAARPTPYAAQTSRRGKETRKWQPPQQHRPAPRRRRKGGPSRSGTSFLPSRSPGHFGGSPCSRRAA
jgi:membrane protease YdiL (CAAX protease family)